MDTVKDFIKTLYKYIKDKYWGDPVWSKVISAGIIALTGSVITTIYLLIKALIDRISFKRAFDQLIFFSQQKTPINNLLLITSILILIIIFIRFLLKFINDVRKNKLKQSEFEATKDLPIVPFESTAFFAYRIAGAFPGERGLVWYNDPKVIVERLSILFQSPLKFKSDERDGFSSTPFWWFRGMSSMYIDNFEKLSKTKILMGGNEIEVKRMAVNIDRVYYKCFIYIEAKGESQTGLYKIEEAEIKNHIDTFGYSWEEFALFKKIPVRRAEYDDGAAVVNSKVVDISGAKLRMRFLSDYNFLLAGHDSPYNSNKLEKVSEEYFNGILTNKVNPESFFNFLSTFRKNER